MKKNGKKLLILGTALLVMFAIWTCLIQCVDVQSAGQKGAEIGFATFNCWFHRVTGVHMAIYTISDWLGLVPIFVSMKVLWIAVALMTLILVGVGITDVVTGRAAISKNYKEFSGREIDDSLIKEVQEAEDPDHYIVFRSFINFCMGTADYENVNEQEVYATRENNNQDQMKQAKLSAAEINYWNQKEAEVKKPFTYQYEEGYAGIYTSVYVANFMLLLLSAIGICGIFADERINGTDQIIFSSVSKEKLFIAKILAGLSMGIILAVYLYGALSICSFGIYGFSGVNAPLQIRIPGCMLNITIGQTYIYLCVLFLIAGIIYSAFAMFLSQVLNNRSAATAIMVIGLFLSMINVPEAFGLLSKVWSYLPGAYIGSWTFTEYRLIHIFGKFFNNLQMAPVFWVIASMIFIAIAGCSYKQYQVKGK